MVTLSKIKGVGGSLSTRTQRNVGKYPCTLTSCPVVAIAEALLLTPIVIYPINPSARVSPIKLRRNYSRVVDTMRSSVGFILW
jgi:hypothetical protein